GLRDRQVRRYRVEHAGKANRLSRLDTKGHDVLDLEIDRVADPNAVAHAIVLDLDRRSLDTEHLPDQRRQPRHRPAELAAKDLRELACLLIRRALVDEHPEAPIPVCHHFRGVRDCRDLEPADVSAFDLTLANVEHEHYATEVVG